MENDIEIVFVQCVESHLPQCKSPMRQLQDFQRYIISMDEVLMESILTNTDLYELMYLTDSIIHTHYGRLQLSNFQKMCKLHFLQKLKLCGKPIIVFTSLHIIDQLGPEFVSNSKDGLIREIRCISYLHEDSGFEGYYVTFNNTDCNVGGLNSFTCEKIAVLSRTALM